ncbi:hypothetical protein JCM8097_004972 [Rhodosporidiobolus ruineniae]
MPLERLTLAQQLAQLNDAAPVDFDPEDAYATYADERKGGDNDGFADEEGQAAKDSAAAARADYVDVGQSKLRKRGEAVLDAKYQGKKGSRAALYGDDDSDSEFEFDNEEDEGSEDDDENDGMDAELQALMDGGEDYESDEDEGGFEDLEAGGEDGADDDEDEEDEDEEEEEEAPRSKKGKEAAALPKSRVSKDDRAMVKQLKQAANADVEKGRDVKKQLAFSDSLLGTRIAIQKAVQASNALPTPASHPPAEVYFAAEDEEGGVQNALEGVWAEVVECSEELFELRKTLLTANESLAFPSDFGSTRKRKRQDMDDDVPSARADWLEETIRDLGEMEKLLDPFLRTTVTKWSDKVLAASGLALKGGDKKFKAVNQNAMQQIDHALSSSTGERDRLVKRTRVRRITEGVGSEVMGKRQLAPGEVPLEGEEGKSAKEVDVECFDDSDWYSQVLRDVVESRMLDLDDVTLTQLRTATALARGKKVKKVVDTRASKGRKIRYHVHEKAQNFMIPVEAGHWHDEQIDELFASLLGRSFPQSQQQQDQAPDKLDPALDDAAPRNAGEIEVGSLRLFG